MIELSPWIEWSAFAFLAGWSFAGFSIGFFFFVKACLLSAGEDDDDGGEGDRPANYDPHDPQDWRKKEKKP